MAFVKSSANTLAGGRIPTVIVEIKPAGVVGVDINSIFKELNIKPFPDMIRMELCKYGYKITKKLLLEPLIRLAHDRGGKKVHRYCHGLKIRVFYFLYISQTFQMNRISFMVAQVNAVLQIH